MITEVRIVQAKAPAHYRLARLRRWRWDVTYQRPIEGPHPGVYDRRQHHHGASGCTITRMGASVAAGRALRP